MGFLEVGQEVRVRVASVDVERGRLGLSMKADGGAAGGLRTPVDVSAFESISPEVWLKGTVANIAQFGAFVTVTTEDGSASAEGLVHITQIRDGFIENVEDELEAGQEVQ